MWWHKISSWWAGKHDYAIATIPEVIRPFLEFNCKCGALLTLDTIVAPGDAAVVDCDNCSQRWAVICPSLQVKRVEDVEALWPILSQ